MSSLPDKAFRLKDISPKAYEHPADRAATAALASIPYLDTVVRKLSELGYEHDPKFARYIMDRAND